MSEDFWRKWGLLGSYTFGFLEKITHFDVTLGYAKQTSASPVDIPEDNQWLCEENTTCMLNKSK